MLNPGIGKLLEETDSPYSLVIAIAKRARDIVSEYTEKDMLNNMVDKPVTMAINDFYNKKYRVVQR